AGREGGDGRRAEALPLGAGAAVDPLAEAVERVGGGSRLTAAAGVDKRDPEVGPVPAAVDAGVVDGVLRRIAQVADVRRDLEGLEPLLVEPAAPGADDLEAGHVRGRGGGVVAARAAAGGEHERQRHDDDSISWGHGAQ